MLAVVHGPQSVEPMRFAEAAEGVADLVWLVDLADPRLGEMAHLIGKLGTVLDTTGLGPGEVADRLAEHGPDGIMTLVDEQMVTTAQIAERLSLPFYDQRTALALADKHAQREALRVAGVSVPRFCVVPAGSTADDAGRIASLMTFPAVLKPLTGTASAGVQSVADAADLRRMLARGEAASGGLLLEERLEGARDCSAFGTGSVAGASGCVAVESVVAGGEICHLAVAGRFALEEPFRGTGSFVPSNLDRTALQPVLDVTEDAARALGMTRGWMNTDVKLTSVGTRVLEVNGRVGGNVPEMFELLDGPHLLAMAMLLALGVDPAVPGMFEFDRVAFYFSAQAPMTARRLVALEGLDRVAALPGVRHVVRRHNPGDELDWREGSAGYLFAVFGTAEDHDQLWSLRHAVDDLVSAVYEYS